MKALILRAIFIGLLVLSILYLMKYRGSAKKYRAYEFISALIATDALGSSLIVAALILILIISFF